MVNCNYNSHLFDQYIVVIEDTRHHFFNIEIFLFCGDGVFLFPIINGVHAGASAYIKD